MAEARRNPVFADLPPPDPMPAATPRTLTDADSPTPRPPPHTPEEKPGSGDDPRLFWSWLRFWVEMAVLAVLAIGGAFFASAGGPPGAYTCGLMLAAAAFVLAVLLVKRRLDGAPDDLASLMLVEDMRSLALVIPLFTLIALAGIFIARAFLAGPLYLFGIGLFGASVLAILLEIKHVFDSIEQGGG
jgi:hypothetical protein